MWNLCTQNPGPSAEVCLGLWNYGTKKNDPSGCGFSIVVLWIIWLCLKIYVIRKIINILYIPTKLAISWGESRIP